MIGTPNGNTVGSLFKQGISEVLSKHILPEKMPVFLSTDHNLCYLKKYFPSFCDLIFC